MIYKSILVTGGCGFIGSNFINYIFNKMLSTRIVNIDAMYYCASETNIDDKVRNSSRYTFVKGKLQDYKLVSDLLILYGIDCVVNFAAQSHVQKSFTDALLYTDDNVLGTHTLLETCRLYGKLKLFIHVSTDEVYGESQLSTSEVCKYEESVLCPSNPYAATKAGAELIVQSYYHSFKMPIIITRGNNVYGPSQYPEKLIPLFTKLLLENKKVTIQGDGSCVRAFLYVDDVCNAFYQIIVNGKIGEIYNIGCDDDHSQEYSVMDVAKKLIEKLKNTKDYDNWIRYIEDRNFNDKRYYISNKKLKNIGWNINYNFDRGLDLTIDWFINSKGNRFIEN